MLCLRNYLLLVIATGSSLLSACGDSPKVRQNSLTIAAAANLTGAMDRLGEAFEKQVGVKVVISYGSTAQLTRQIEHGGPFDVFAAADTEHVDALIEMGKIQRASRLIYVRGQLALWIPNSRKPVRELADLTGSDIQYLAVAKPDLAPYGAAAVETLKAAGIWDVVQPKITYATSVSMARQYAASGNAEAAFTAYSLVLNDSGAIIKVDPKLHHPLDQAAGAVTSSPNLLIANEFLSFLKTVPAQTILVEHGYTSP